MATNYIDYEKLYNAQGALRNQIDDILDLIAEIKEIKNNIETIKETHDGFGTSLTWAQDILERLREYRALYSTIATYCRVVPLYSLKFLANTFTSSVSFNKKSVEISSFP